MLEASDFEGQYQRRDDLKSVIKPGMTLDEIERQTILQALDLQNGNISQVALSLGISRAALYRRLEKYGINY